MNFDDFEKVKAARMRKCSEVLGLKADEYAAGGDRLSNFKQAGALQKCSAERALVGMLIKHIVSIVDMARDIDSGKMATYAQWNEKMGDSINYLILLDALIVERLNITK